MSLARKRDINMQTQSFVVAFNAVSVSGVWCLFLRGRVPTAWKEGLALYPRLAPAWPLLDP